MFDIIEMENKGCYNQASNLEERYDIGEEISIVEEHEIRVVADSEADNKVLHNNDDVKKDDHVHYLRQSSLPEIHSNSPKRGIFLVIAFVIILFC